jgi:hypothetical protein
MKNGTTIHITIAAAAAPNIIPVHNRSLSSRAAASLYIQPNSGSNGKKSPRNMISFTIDTYPPNSMLDANISGIDCSKNAHSHAYRIPLAVCLFATILLQLRLFNKIHFARFDFATALPGENLLPAGFIDSNL